MKRQYHSLLTKPVDLFCTNALIYSSVETFEYFQVYLGWPLGIVVSTAVFRFFLYPVGKSLEKINWRLPKIIEPSCEKLYKTLLLNDLENDVRKLGLKSDDFEKLKNMIKPSILMSQMIQGYLCLNFARGLSQISLNAIHHPGMSDSIMIFWTMADPDPLYVAPVLSACLSKLALSNSFHPFTLPLTENAKFWISFLIALASLPVPLSYHLSSWTFISIHLLLKRFFPKRTSTQEHINSYYESRVKKPSLNPRIKQFLIIQNIVRFKQFCPNQSVRDSSKTRVEKLNDSKPLCLPKVKQSPLASSVPKNRRKRKKNLRNEEVQPVTSSEFKEILSKRREFLNSA